MVDFVSEKTSERYSAFRTGDTWKIERWDHRVQSRAVEFFESNDHPLLQEFRNDKILLETINRLGSLLSRLSSERRGTTQNTMRLELKILAKYMGAQPESSMSLAQIGSSVNLTKQAADLARRRLVSQLADMRMEGIFLSVQKPQVPYPMHVRALENKNSATATN
jgi:hypothetical protein